MSKLASRIDVTISETLFVRLTTGGAKLLQENHLHDFCVSGVCA